MQLLYQPADVAVEQSLKNFDASSHFGRKNVTDLKASFNTPMHL